MKCPVLALAICTHSAAAGREPGAGAPALSNSFGPSQCRWEDWVQYCSKGGGGNGSATYPPVKRGTSSDTFK